MASSQLTLQLPPGPDGELILERAELEDMLARIDEAARRGESLHFTFGHGMAYTDVRGVAIAIAPPNSVAVAVAHNDITRSIRPGKLGQLVGGGKRYRKRAWLLGRLWSWMT